MRRMLLTAVFSVPSLAAPNLAAMAQTATRLPDVVVTATRIPTPIEQIPAGVTIIDRETIEQRGYTTLVDALSSVPGMHVVQSGGQGGNASVFIRGTNSNHVLVLRDGMPINDPSDPGGAFNFGVDRLGDVERIEVVRGPMSSLYGSGAIGGVINLITAKGEDGIHGTAELGFGLPRASLASAGLSGKVGQFDFNLNAQTGADVGSDTTPQRERVYTGSRNSYRSTLGSINLGYTPVEGTRISAYLRGRTAAFNLDELGFPAYDSRNYRGTDDAVYGRIGGTSKLFDGKLETSLFVGRLQTDRHYMQPLETGDPNRGQGDTRYHGTRTDLQWNNTLHLPDVGPSASNALIFGYAHTQDTSRSNLTSGSGPFAYKNNVSAYATSDAGHAGVQSTLWQRLTLTADARQESATYGGDAFTWRAGGVLAVPEILSHFKASYGTAFRAPSLYDLFGVDNFGYVGNRGLRPERSQGYELGWGIDIPAFGQKKAASIEVTYFNNRIRDLITTVYNASFTASTTQNVNRASSQGVETSLTVRPLTWLEATAAYTYTDARNLATNQPLLRRPRQQISLGGRASPLPGLNIAPELIYTSSFQDYLTDDNGFGAGVGRAKSGAIFNLTVSYDITPAITAFVNGRNLGNSRFEPASGYQTPGASALAGVRARF